MPKTGRAQPSESPLVRICTSRWIEWGRSRPATDVQLVLIEHCVVLNQFCEGCPCAAKGSVPLLKLFPRPGFPLPLSNLRSPSPTIRMSGEDTAEDTLSLGKHPKFLCGVAVSVYQNSGGPPEPLLNCASGLDFRALPLSN